MVPFAVGLTQAGVPALAAVGSAEPVPAVVTVPAAAQDTVRPVPADTVAPSPAIGDTIVTDLLETVTDAGALFTRPLRFGAGDWGIAGAAVAATGLGMLADDPVRTEMKRQHGAAGDVLADAGNLYGTPLPAAAIGGGLYLSGLIADAPGVRRAGRHVMQAVLYAGLVTTTLKVVIGRHRPFLNDGPQVYRGPTLQDPYHSLPSGHSTLAFALSSVLAAEIDNPFATIALYGMASVTGLSRIYADRHWTSDVVLGAAIGTACGYGVAHLHDIVFGHTGLLLTPLPNGLLLTVRF